MHRSKATFAAVVAALAVTSLTATYVHAGGYGRTVVVRRTYPLPTYRACPPTTYYNYPTTSYYSYSYPVTTYVSVGDAGCIQTPVYRTSARCVRRPAYVAPAYRTQGVRFGYYRTAHRGYHWNVTERSYRGGSVHARRSRHHWRH